MIKCSTGIRKRLFMNKKITEIKIDSEFILLGQFLKFADIIQSGGEAKSFLTNNVVHVNGEVEQRRGKKLRSGDQIEIKGNCYLIK